MLVTEFLEAVRTRLSIESSRWLVEVDEVADHAATTPKFQTPRYVWVPTRDTFAPPERAGGNPRPILTREAGLELHLWADTVADAETRLLSVLVALHEEGATSVLFGAANWSGPSAIGRGVLVTLEMRLKTPVVRAAAAVGQATSVAPDTADIAQGDGKLDWGETT